MMPKEVIQYPRMDDDLGHEMSLHWGREHGVVQVHLERHPWKRVEDKFTGSTVPDRSSPEAVEIFGHPMSRVEINHFIRSLRKARDQVFGRDE